MSTQVSYTLRREYVCLCVFGNQLVKPTELQEIGFTSYHFILTLAFKVQFKNVPGFTFQSHREQSINDSCKLIKENFSSRFAFRFLRILAAHLSFYCIVRCEQGISSACTLFASRKRTDFILS